MGSRIPYMAFGDKVPQSRAAPTPDKTAGECRGTELDDRSIPYDAIAVAAYSRAAPNIGIAGLYELIISLRPQLVSRKLSENLFPSHADAPPALDPEPGNIMQTIRRRVGCKSDG